MAGQTTPPFTDEQTAALIGHLAQIEDQRKTQMAAVALQFLTKLPVEAYTALKHIQALASPQDWEQVAYKVARTLVDAQYEITHRQIIEHMKVENLEPMESDEDILAAAVSLTS